MSKLPMLLFIIVLSQVLASPAIGSNRRTKQKQASSLNKIIYKNDRLYKNYNYSTNWSHNNNFLRNYKPGVIASKARIARQKHSMRHNGVYTYGFESENGIDVEESGKTVKTAPKTESPVVQGHFSFITPDGLRVSVKYTADETGFHPVITYDGPNAKVLANQARPADVIINRIETQKDTK